MSELINITVALKQYHMQVLEAYAEEKGHSRAASANYLLQTFLELLAPSYLKDYEPNNMLLLIEFMRRLVSKGFDENVEITNKEIADILYVSEEELIHFLKKIAED